MNFRSRGWWVGILAFTLGRAHADGQTEPSRSTVVFEAYTGARPDDADQIVGPLLKRLEDGDWNAFPASVLQAVGDRLPKPGHVDPTMTIAKIRDTFTRATEKATAVGFSKGGGDEAVSLYVKAFTWVRENPALVITDRRAREWLTEAYVNYVNTLNLLGRRDEANDAALAQVTSFPDVPVTKDEFGPDAVKPFDEARKKSATYPRGSLLVTITDRSSAAVAINNVPRGRGSSFQADVIKAHYGVLVQVEDLALRYDFVPDPAVDEHSELRIDWDLDSHLVTSGPWIGAANVPSSTATKLTRKLPTHSVAIVSIVDRGAKRWLVGTRYAVGGDRVLVRCVAEVGSRAQTALAPCLFGGVRIFPEVFNEIPGESGGSDREASELEASIPAQWPMWVGFAATVGGIAAGAIFVGQHGQCLDGVPGYPCTRRANTKVPAAISLGAGAAALAFTTIWYLRYAGAVEKRTRAPAIGFGVESGGASITYSGTFK